MLSSEICENFKKTYFEEHHGMSASITISGFKIMINLATPSFFSVNIKEKLKEKNTNNSPSKSRTEVYVLYHIWPCDQHLLTCYRKKQQKTFSIL